MQPFNFSSSATPVEAVKAHALSQASQFIAGGTSLLDLMKLHVETPNLVVDITPLPLTSVSSSEKTVQIGAMVTNSDLARHPLILADYPVLSQALLSGASPQLRNLATVGGNLLQRTRCSYFRDTACACNKREPGSGCSALHGQNRMHAILGSSSHCIAAHPSDFCVALAALDAKVIVEGPASRRTIAFQDFYRVPGATPHIENSLGRDELITSVELPRQQWFRNSAYIKVRDRASYAFALTSAAVALDLANGVTKDVRIALGGVGTVPWRAFSAEASLKGKALTAESIGAACEIALKDASAYEHNRFKIDLAKRTLARTLRQVGGLS